MSNENSTIERPKELKELDNLFGLSVDYIDKHLREIRYATCAVAVLGGVIAFRSLRVVSFTSRPKRLTVKKFSQFRRAKDVPREYVSKNLKLRGIVRKVNPENGALLVEHIPIMQIWHRKTPETLLPVTLSGVKVGGLGYQWLDIAARNHLIEFTLLTRNLDKNEVQCVVTSLEGPLKKRCLNQEMVALGFGQVASISDSLKKNKTYRTMYNRLLELESKAFRERNGIWSTMKPENNWHSYLTSMGAFIYRLVNSIKTFTSKKTLALK